jgi:hypothetical protein
MSYVGVLITAHRYHQRAYKHIRYLIRLAPVRQHDRLFRPAVLSRVLVIVISVCNWLVLSIL